MFLRVSFIAFLCLTVLNFINVLFQNVVLRPLTLEPLILMLVDLRPLTLCFVIYYWELMLCRASFSPGFRTDSPGQFFISSVGEFLAYREQDQILY